MLYIGKSIFAFAFLLSSLFLSQLTPMLLQLVLLSVNQSHAEMGQFTTTCSGFFLFFACLVKLNHFVQSSFAG